MAPAAVVRFDSRALVLLDRELAPERRVGAATVPNEDEFAHPAAAAICSEEAVRAIRDRRLHRLALDAGHEMLAREAHVAGDGGPADLVAGRAHGAIGAERAASGFQVINGGVGIEWASS